MTNGDRIRAMSNDKLAELFNDFADRGVAEVIPFCANNQECMDAIESGGDIDTDECRVCLREWLDSKTEWEAAQ